LAALQGYDALRAKISLILEQDDDMRGATREALATTRNLPLQLSLLEAAWNDPQRPPIYDMHAALQETRALLRGEMLQGSTMSVGGSKGNERVAARLAAKEHAADMEALIDSLPKRSGQSRTDAAYYLLEDHSLSPAQIAVVKPVALQEFSRMNGTEQRMLLETAWPAIRDASLETDLTAMLDKFPTDKDALRRLIELNPQGAKSYVARAVCKAQPAVPFDSVAGLPDATLPEVEVCLGQLLRIVPTGPGETHDWKGRALLAARFASPAILPLVRQGWKNPEQDGPVLALLLRYRPEEAVSKIEAVSPATRMNIFFDINRVFKALGARFPEGFADWLRQRVKDGPDDDGGFAGYELSKGGAPEDRTLLEERLARVRSEWSARTDEVASASPGSAAGKARKLDLELMSALRTSTAWSLSDEDAAQLARGCMSDQCKLYGEGRKEVQQNQAH
jgi:hypothetical protein